MVYGQTKNQAHQRSWVVYKSSDTTDGHFQVGFTSRETA